MYRMAENVKPKISLLKKRSDQCRHGTLRKFYKRTTLSASRWCSTVYQGQKMPSTLFASLALTALGCCFPGVDAFWRMNCGIIQLGRVDPIVNYDGVSGHVHIIGGPNSWFVLATVLLHANIFKISILPLIMICSGTPYVHHARFKKTKAPTGLPICITRRLTALSSA